MGRVMLLLVVVALLGGALATRPSPASHARQPPALAGNPTAFASKAAPVSQPALQTRAAQSSQDEGTPVIIASKPFAESYILAEIFAQLLEARGIAVDRRFGLGATEIAFGALREGAIDIYPEYTGTALAAILGEEMQADAEAVYRHVAGSFRERWDARWLAPLGFENTYAIAVRRETAEELGLATLSDLAREAGGLRAGFTPDFIGRSDGLPGLRAAYGFEAAEVLPLLQAVKYEALVESGVDVIDGYSTDGLIARYDLVVLEDDRSFFPPYEAAGLVNGDFWRRRPDAIAALSELSGLLDEERVREWNRRAESDGDPVAEIARDALAELGLVVPDAEEAVESDLAESAPARESEREAATAAESARSPVVGFASYMWQNRTDILGHARRHIVLVIISLAAAALLAIPAGLMLVRVAGGAEGVIRTIGLVQTIPSLALLAFMIPALGIGVVPAVFALFLYSLFPILRNTYTGVRDANPAAVDAARALGMTPAQLLRHVRLPLAAPVIMAGLRTAAVINVGTATIAAFIGAGGLGDPIVAGLALSDTRMILSGAIPAAALALLVDGALGLAEKRVAPGGVTVE
ncbi:MAG: ABC transporter permease subunit [Gammaproteobacteria bacterium]|nr:ABC transporter permease subunit [Gammaproteobacteria bacterium]MDE0257955.1 ABC transporter permease subunit [Gammaproteobacteria bacterium]